MSDLHDIVYILKADVKPDELRYSLRSVCENFTFRDVWFYGGCPDGIVPDHHVPFQQHGSSKWERSTSTLQAICANDDVTPAFYLFNDDFFVLRPYAQDDAVVNGTIAEHADAIAHRHGGVSSYVRLLRAQAAWLRRNGYPTMNYATHTPLRVERDRALEVMGTASAALLFRNVYGNMAGAPYVLADDVKIAEQDMQAVPPDLAALCSTSDRSFRDGAVGRWIHARFPEPCRYEL